MPRIALSEEEVDRLQRGHELDVNDSVTLARSNPPRWRGRRLESICVRALRVVQAAGRNAIDEADCIANPGERQRFIALIRREFLVDVAIPDDADESDLIPIP